MKRRIAILTKNPYLAQKVRLELSEETVLAADTPDAIDYADCWLVDGDTLPPPEVEGEVVYLAHASTKTPRDAARIDLPLPIGRLRDALAQVKPRAPLVLIPARRTVLLNGESIRLTDVEYALLQAIAKREGAFVARAELLREVWDEGKEDGVLNVYVHYLREKLETHGEKVLLSSRNRGYAIHPKFFGKE